jgi:hypothetical protein
LIADAEALQERNHGGSDCQEQVFQGKFLKSTALLVMVAAVNVIFEDFLHVGLFRR